MTGDLDLDGIPELLVGLPYASSGGFQFNGVVEMRSGANGALLFRYEGTVDFQKLGSVLAAGHDVDGDGIDDFLLGTPDAAPLGRTDAGMFDLYSGATGLLLQHEDGAIAGDRLGAAAALLGDLNADGRSEYLLGASGSNTAAGSAVLYDGATRLPLQTFVGTATEAFGSAVAAAGDIDHDGTRDFLIGAPFAATNGMLENGRAVLLSGASYAALRQHDGLANGDRFGSSLDGDELLDLDATPDYLIGAPNASRFAPSAGAAYAYSGATGSLSFQVDGQNLADNLGDCIALCGDVDGDGFGDALVGARLVDANGLADSGSVLLLGGRDGSLLFRADGSVALDNLGRAVDGGRDYDGDGFPDFLYTAPFADPGGRSLAGSMDLIRLRPILTATTTTLPAALGGNVDFPIDFPLSESGSAYLLLASRSGVGPTLVQGVSIPLTNDSLLRAMVTSPPAVFTNSSGTLDGAGDALAQLMVGPNVATGLVGTTVHLSVTSLAPGGGPALVSNLVALAILP